MSNKAAKTTPPSLEGVVETQEVPVQPKYQHLFVLDVVGVEDITRSVCTQVYKKMINSPVDVIRLNPTMFDVDPNQREDSINRHIDNFTDGRHPREPMFVFFGDAGSKVKKLEMKDFTEDHAMPSGAKGFIVYVPGSGSVTGLVDLIYDYIYSRDQQD